jgi:hypothetical protein
LQYPSINTDKNISSVYTQRIIMEKNKNKKLRSIMIYYVIFTDKITKIFKFIKNIITTFSIH